MPPGHPRRTFYSMDNLERLLNSFCEFPRKMSLSISYSVGIPSEPLSIKCSGSPVCVYVCKNLNLNYLDSK